MSFISRIFSLQTQSDRSFGRMAVRDRFNDIVSRVAGPEPVIVDGGANKGTITETFRTLYPRATIYAFEPIPFLIEKLKERFGHDDKIVVMPYAMGASNEQKKFNILNYENSSSLLKPSDINFHYHKEKMQTAREVTVEVRRLDEMIPGPPDILKLDLQGYELEALKGCEKILPGIKAITTEIEFVPLYNGQPLFGDIDVFLRSKGFYLLNLYELYTHKDGQLTAGDAVYLNENYFNRIK